MARDEYGYDPDETYVAEDNPFYDATDGAHPAWWRGQKYTIEVMDMTFRTFRSLDELVEKTSVYPDCGNNFNYAAIGLAGEVGEILNKWKKVVRDDGGVLNQETREALLHELGDVLWYVAAAAYELGYKTDRVAKVCSEKLLDRKERGALKGSGDAR